MPAQAPAITAPGPTPRRKAEGRLTPVRLVRLFVLLVCAFVLLLIGWHTRHARELEITEAKVTTANLARSLADHAQSTIDAADALVTGLVERLEVDGISDPALARLHRMMINRVRGSSRVRELIAYAADGTWLASSLENAPIGVNGLGREYFIYHREHADRGLHVGPPIQSRANGRWTITVSRRFDRPDGSFGGIALAMIDFDTFRTFYERFDIGAHGLISLLNDDGIMLVRSPADLDTIGRNFSDYEFFREYRQSGPIGTAQGVSPVDGVNRIKSFRRVEDLPLVVFVALSDDDLLANWRLDAGFEFGVACIACLIVGALGWHLAAQIRLRQRADDAVRSNERQYRLLADNSTDVIIQLGPDLLPCYVSPASTALLGYRPQELIGVGLPELAHPEDRTAVGATLARLAAEGQAPPLACRFRHANGSHVWLEGTGRKMLDDERIVIAMRDIGDRKTAENLLHDANNQLQRMVMLDGLTGIANRRCFDLVLEKEFRRAGRTQQPLTLLLLDVDHFKAYNDTYGHPAGDACLQAIARAIGQQMRRPADLVARYGGEEFAVVLPETGAAGATDLAERVRRAVRRLNVEHRGAPRRLVTISVGVAVVVPRHDCRSAKDLVAQVDQALYRAKADGRDCVHTATADPVTIKACLA